jgi:hypothetical protein
MTIRAEYGRAQASSNLIIVEPYFKAQFEIGRPSGLYSRCAAGRMHPSAALALHIMP